MPKTSAAASPQGSRGPLGPIDIALQADIRAPVELVWSLLVDWERMSQWMREASGFRVTTDHREGVGVEVEARVRIGGITTTDTIRVTRWEPPHVLAADHLGWVKGDAIMQCIPTDQGTRFEWVERLAPPLGPIGGIGIRLFKPLMVRVFFRDLSLLKRLAETQAGTRRPRPSPAAGEGAARRPRPSPVADGPRTRAGEPPANPETGQPDQPEGPEGNCTFAPRASLRPERKARGGRLPGGKQPTSNAAIGDAGGLECSVNSLPAPEPARRARPAKAATAPRQRVRGPAASSLFARWFWLVYLPLGLTAAVLALTVAGLMPPGLRTPLLVLTGAWSALAVCLLFERRRRRVAIRAPRSIVLGIGAVVVMALGGGLLTWIGIGKVSSSEGLTMLLVGCFFILMAVFAPMFKLVDSALRLVARVLTRRSRSPEHAPPAHAEAPATASPVIPATESSPQS